MKNLITILFVLFSIQLFSQQLPDRSNFEGNSFVWNPAMTAVRTYWELGATYKQQWLGFQDAPRTAIVSFQYPFVDTNMSAGVFITHDNTHPIQFNSISFTYNYQLPLNLFKDDRLSIGIMGSMGEFSIDSDRIMVGDAADVLLPNDEVSSLIPNAGFGIFYISEKERFYNNGFYIGIGSNQLLSNDLIFDTDGTPLNLRRDIHANGIVGFTFLAAQDLLIEPSVWVDYASKNVTNINFGILLEKQDAFWGGLNFSLSQEFSLQAGLILKEGFFKDGIMRIGTKASYNMGTLGMDLGFGYEFYVAYRFENE